MQRYLSKNMILPDIVPHGFGSRRLPGQRVITSEETVHQCNDCIISIDCLCRPNEDALLECALYERPNPLPSMVETIEKKTSQVIKADQHEHLLRAYLMGES